MRPPENYNHSTNCICPICQLNRSLTMPLEEFHAEQLKCFWFITDKYIKENAKNVDDHFETSLLAQNFYNAILEFAIDYYKTHTKTR